MNDSIEAVLSGASRWAVVQGDCLDAMRSLPDGCVDAVVTDPPYGLSFMGKTWDHGVPGVPFWSEALRVAKPGAHLLAFGGTRTFHRLAVAIEDAGWEIRDCLSWLYGSGFPKSHNLAGDWGGWGTALKPAWEPIILARKPLAGTVAATVLAHGTGALNIDASRIEGAPPSVPQPNFSRDMRAGFGASDGRNGDMSQASGRWPANVALDEDAAAMLDAQSGELAAGNRPKVRNVGSPFMAYGNGQSGGAERMDAGGASRFFYCAKASRAEREAGCETNPHPTVKPVDLMRWLVRLVTPPGGLVLDPFAGSGSTGVAANAEGFRFLGIEREAEYVDIARRRIADAAAQGNLFGGAS